MVKHNRGFTLVELMIVLVLMIAIGALGITAAAGWSHTDRVRATAQGITSALKEARSQAIAMNRPFQLVAIPTDLDRYRLSAVTIPAPNSERADEFASFDAEGFKDEGHEHPEPRSENILYEVPEGIGLELSKEEPGAIAFDQFAESDAQIVLANVYPDGTARFVSDDWVVVSRDSKFQPVLDEMSAKVTLELIAEDPVGGEMEILP